ncbi:hypothetical protein G6F59_018668 [Rhizopus arrhizus]|nr:hypothetical protein G6F59_018668 [Rhizopus arrhizus]
MSTTSSEIASRVCESSAEKGSSSRITSGSVTSVRASAARCRMPPDNWRGVCDRNAPSPHFSSRCTARASLRASRRPWISAPRITVSRMVRQSDR